MKQFNELLTAYTEAAMTAALYADQDSAAAAATWAAVANDHRQRLLADHSELEAELAQARIENRKLEYRLARIDKDMYDLNIRAGSSATFDEAFQIVANAATGGEG